MRPPRALGTPRQQGMLETVMTDFLRFLGENKVWWITPLVLVLALVAFLVFSDSSAGTQADEGFQYDMY